MNIKLQIRQIYCDYCKSHARFGPLIHFTTLFFEKFSRHEYSNQFAIPSIQSRARSSLDLAGEIQDVSAAHNHVTNLRGSH